MMLFRTRSVAIVAALLVGGLLGVQLAGPALGSGPVLTLSVHTKALPLNPADPGANQLGRLRFLGALQLQSADDRFGGLSGLLWQGACNRLLAISDTGQWVVLTPKEQRGQLIGISSAWMAPILDENGQPPRNKRAADAEELAETKDGKIWVFYEQTHRAESYQGLSACQPHTLATAATSRLTLPQMADWPKNGGAEAATAIENALLLISEEASSATGGRQALLSTPPNSVASLYWPNPTGFNPTAADTLPRTTPEGPVKLLILHRQLSPLQGLSAQISEAALPAATAMPGTAEKPAALTGSVIAQLRPPFTVDNMEGLAVRQEAGRTFIYLVSDNNFQSFQRTILMKFELLPN